MKRRILLAALAAVLLSGFAVADTLTLKDGTTHQGEVLRETEEEIVMNVELSAGLREEQTFKKEDVLKLHRTTVDERTFEEKIKPLVPTPDRLSSSDYSKRIDGVIKPFLNAFPQSKHRSATEKILRTLEEEKARVDAGGIKLAGEWLSGDERATNAYEIDAKILALEMMALAEEGNYTQALRKFDELQLEYTASKTFQESIPAVLKILDQYETRIKADLAQVDQRVEQRDKAFETLNPSQRKAAEDDVARRAEAYDKRIEFEKKKRFRWLTLDPYHDRPMETTLRQIDNVRNRLEKFDPERIKLAGDLYRQAWTAASRGRRDKTEELVRELRRSRVPQKYVDGIEARLKQAEEEGVVYEEPEPEEEEPEEEMEESPSEEAAEEAEEEEKPDEEAARSERADDDRSSARDDDDEEAGSGSVMKVVLFVIMGVVILVGLAAAFAGKKKK